MRLTISAVIFRINKKSAGFYGSFRHPKIGSPGSIVGSRRLRWPTCAHPSIHPSAFSFQPSSLSLNLQLSAFNISASDQLQSTSDQRATSNEQGATSEGDVDEAKARCLGCRSGAKAEPEEEATSKLTNKQQVR